MRVQTFISAVRQTGVHGPGLVSRIGHLKKNLIQGLRQTLSAILGFAGQRCPTAFNVLLIRLFEALGCRHRLGIFIMLTTLFIPRLVQRENDLFAKFGALFQYRIDRVSIDFGKARHVLKLVLHLQHFVQYELHIA